MFSKTGSFQQRFWVFDQNRAHNMPEAFGTDSIDNVLSVLSELIDRFCRLTKSWTTNTSVTEYEIIITLLFKRNTSF